MRIAYLINQYPKISHSFIRREIAALEQQGFAITRIALRGWDDLLVDDADKAERTRTQYVLRAGASGLLAAAANTLLTHPIRLAQALGCVWRLSRRAERPLWVHLIYLFEACYVERRLRSEKIQHVHAHFGTNSAEVALLVHKLGGPTWSFTVHGPEEFDKALLIRLADKIRNCTFAVAISSYGRSQLYRLVQPVDWPKIHVVRCGLDITFLNEPMTAIPSTRRLVCVGRLCEQKGQLLLLEAAHRLASAGVDFELVLAGDGELRGELEALVARYELKGKVRITGWVNGHEVRKEILAARSLVLPSFAEGLPVVIMEAMALRRPIISTYVAGIPELVFTGEHGWLVPAGDLEALVGVMKECLDTTIDALESMGQAAHERVIILHDANKEAAVLANLIQSAVMSSG